ncbi:hypothetical protein C7B80_12135 [Cyanosarcina cf. burmensis CCALA 770]|nr:hypothetical protein C7B80_12135 [Cyanosarcina cf. burmensis CCALA 770]
MNYLNKAKTLIAPVVASLCAVAILSIQLPKSNIQQAQTDQAESIKQEQLEKSRLILLKKLPTFGFSNLVGDWGFLQFIQYFGDGEARKYTGYSLSPDYFELVVNRNPRLVKAYLYLSPATSIYAGRPDRSVALFAQGLKSISPHTDPKAYFLWMYKAVDELLFLGDHQAARHSYEMAAQWASNSQDKSSKLVADRARETAQFLSKNPQSVQARIGAWATILSNARDDASRQLAIDNIQKLGGEVIINPNGLLQIKSPVEK